MLLFWEHRKPQIDAKGSVRLHSSLSKHQTVYHTKLTVVMDRISFSDSTGDLE